MTFNIWHGGDAGKQPLSQTAKVIQMAGADIVGIQETRGHEVNGVRPDNARKIAELLGWHYFDQGSPSGIMSRFPIVTNTPGKFGVCVRLPSGREAWMFNTHLSHAPYQPYQLLRIPYADAPFIATAAEAVDAARMARGAQVERLVAELQPILSAKKMAFLTGDFNEPSHQDWTERAAAAGKCPLAVPYPTTIAITSAGLRDAFRAFHPDEVANPGWTWTPLTKPEDPKDRHDRIDFVFYTPGLVIKACEVIGEAAASAHIVVDPYPSDHRAVAATFEIP
jgi:endonuclease/exonuclease/phosphatase family metal-dependent hydrolase